MIKEYRREAGEKLPQNDGFPATVTLTRWMAVENEPKKSSHESRRHLDPQADAPAIDRKLRMLRRAGLFSDDLKGATIQRACAAEDLKKAYRLVHEVFLEQGFIQPEPAGIRIRIFETTAETATFVAKVGDEVVGVLSVVNDSPDLGLPSDVAFKPELDAMRAQGLRLCEVTNQAVAADFRKTGVATELMRCAIAASLDNGCHEAIATVSPSHNGFYDLLGFREVGDCRSYSTKIYDPVIALSMDITQYAGVREDLSGSRRFMHDFLAKGNRFISRVSEWAKEARREFLTAALLQELFVSERNILAECTPDQLCILHQQWGRELFEAVTGNSLRDAIDHFSSETSTGMEEAESDGPSRRGPFRGTRFPFAA